MKNSSSEPRRREIALNKNALRNYALLESMEAGVVLKGTEVKSLNAHEVTVKDAFVVIRDGTPWLLNAHIPQYSHGNITNHDPNAARKLLMSKAQILAWSLKQKREGLAIVPVSIYWKRNKIKVQIALARSLRKPDKRELIKRRDMDREARKGASG